MAHVYQELSEILQCITQNPLPCLCFENAFLKNLSIYCQKTPHFYQSFEEREKEFIKSTFKGSFWNFSNFTTSLFFQKIKSCFSQFNLLYSNRMCWSSSLYPNSEVSSVLHSIYKCIYCRKTLMEGQKGNKQILYPDLLIKGSRTESSDFCQTKAHYAERQSVRNWILQQNVSLSLISCSNCKSLSLLNILVLLTVCTYLAAASSRWSPSCLSPLDSRAR